MIKVLTSLLLFFFTGVAGITFLALESGGVIEVETWDSQESSLRTTHIWFVETSEGILLEAGNPENPWVKDLSANETITIRGGGIDGEYRIRLIQNETAHKEIRNRMREKYGWRDLWISFLFNVEQSQMVQVFPA